MAHRIAHSVLLALVFLVVQYGSVLHAVEHPFHAHETHHQDHYHHADHTFVNAAGLSHVDERQGSEFNVSCEVFFAGERLADATLQSVSVDLVSISNTQHHIVQPQSPQKRHKHRPRSRSPPVFFA